MQTSSLTTVQINAANDHSKMAIAKEQEVPVNDAAAMMAKDQEEKKAILLKHLLPHCTPDSEHAILRSIAEALRDDPSDSLVCKVISGGKTNYSYKIALKSNRADPLLYAKICFPYALWSGNQDRYYDTIRTQNEFDLMQRCADIMGEGAPIANALLCLQAPDSIRILVTEWATDCCEQFANQFIDGQVDPRLFPKIARCLADIHTKVHCESDFNSNVGDYLQLFVKNELMGFFKAFLESEKSDRCVELGRELGLGTFEEIVHKMSQVDPATATLIHNDTHVFNILVEDKPSLASFGQQGKFVLCDWEMAVFGPTGCDAGKFESMPIAAALGHAAQGHMESVNDILQALDSFWDTYLDALRQAGKDEDFLRVVFKDAMGWSGYMIYLCIYSAKLFTCMLGLDAASETEVERAIESSGVLALHLARTGFTDHHSDKSLSDLRQIHRGLVMDEANLLMRLRKPQRVRGKRGSMLRASNLRVSDSLLMEESVEISLVESFASRKNACKLQLSHDMLAELNKLVENEDW
jgi:thiamine kinase-like enzyme